MKIRPLGTELFHADGRTDMTKLIVTLQYGEDAKKFGANKKQMQVFRRFSNICVQAEGDLC